MEPQIRYVTSADSTRIALRTLGQGRPCVIIPTMSFVAGEAYWHVPQSRANLERLAQGRRIVQYDNRGYGPRTTK